MKQFLGWCLAGASFAFAVRGENGNGTISEVIGICGFVGFMFALEMITDSKIEDLKEKLMAER